MQRIAESVLASVLFVVKSASVGSCRNLPQLSFLAKFFILRSITALSRISRGTYNDISPENLRALYFGRRSWVGECTIDQKRYEIIEAIRVIIINEGKQTRCMTHF